MSMKWPEAASCPTGWRASLRGAEVFRNFDRRFSLALDRSRTRRVIPVRADAAITPLRVTVRLPIARGLQPRLRATGCSNRRKIPGRCRKPSPHNFPHSGDTIFDVREVRSEGCDRFVPVSLLAELRREGWSVCGGRGSTALSSMRFCPRIDRPLSVESPYGRGECYESSGRGGLPRSRGAANCTRTRSGTCDGRGIRSCRSAYCIRREIRTVPEGASDAEKESCF